MRQQSFRHSCMLQFLDFKQLPQAGHSCSVLSLGLLSAVVSAFPCAFWLCLGCSALPAFASAHVSKLPCAFWLCLRCAALPAFAYAHVLSPAVLWLAPVMNVPYLENATLNTVSYCQNCHVSGFCRGAITVQETLWNHKRYTHCKRHAVADQPILVARMIRMLNRRW